MLMDIYGLFKALMFMGVQNKQTKEPKNSSISRLSNQLPVQVHAVNFPCDLTQSIF